MQYSKPLFFLFSHLLHQTLLLNLKEIQMPMFKKDLPTVEDGINYGIILIINMLSINMQNIILLNQEILITMQIKERRYVIIK